MNKEAEAMRMLKQGVNIEAIARKTGVNREWLEAQRRWL